LLPFRPGAAAVFSSKLRSLNHPGNCCGCRLLRLVAAGYRLEAYATLLFGGSRLLYVHTSSQG
jgi:hypothetical protein